jgi:prephenate dehydratase
MSDAQPASYAYLGPAGTFTEAALRQIVSPQDAVYLPKVDVVSAIEAVRSGAADYAVVAIENSVEGGVTAVLDTLATGDHLMILREMLVPVTFVLAARPGTTLADVARISAHPHAWAQCRRWLKATLPAAVHVPATSNTAPAELLAGSEDRLGFDAALVPPSALESYRLTALAEHVADSEHAVTRFVLVGRPGTVPERTGSDKTTFVVHLPSNQAGALLEMLEQLATRGVNLSRIESRPIGDSLGRYSFSMDAEGHVQDERMAEALMGLHRVCPHVRFMGSYPRAAAAAGGPREGTSDEDFTEARAWVAALREGKAF